MVSAIDRLSTELLVSKRLDFSRIVKIQKRNLYISETWLEKNIFRKRSKMMDANFFRIFSCHVKIQDEKAKQS